MAELTPNERLQPSLLDRLTDRSPGSRQETREDRVMGTRELRDAVLRDLTWLLNTANKDRTGEFAEFPNVASSVLNFGVASMTGLTESAFGAGGLSRAVRTAIERFEPRVLPAALKVAEVRGTRGTYNVVGVEIEGDMWAQPLPERLFVRTELDLETGDCRVEASRG